MIVFLSELPLGDKAQKPLQNRVSDGREPSA